MRILVVTLSPKLLSGGVGPERGKAGLPVPSVPLGLVLVPVQRKNILFAVFSEPKPEPVENPKFYCLGF